jgi:rhodanese-related sulfurtransferase
MNTSMSDSLLENLMFHRQRIHLIDIRPKTEFSAAHIRGAHSLPFAELAATRVFQKLPTIRRSTVVISANGGARASLATGILRSAGCENVAPLDGGMNTWIARGLPVERKGVSPKVRASVARATLAALAAVAAVFALHDANLASMILAIAVVLLLGVKTLSLGRDRRITRLLKHVINDHWRRAENSFAEGVKRDHQNVCTGE